MLKKELIKTIKAQKEEIAGLKKSVLELGAQRQELNERLLKASEIYVEADMQRKDLKTTNARLLKITKRLSESLVLTYDEVK